MQTSPDKPDRPVAETDPSPQAAALVLFDLAQSLMTADEANAIAALELAARAGGADAALFVSAIPDGDHGWYRSMAALNADWGHGTLRRLHSGTCTWLAHVARSSEPLLVNLAADDGDATGGGGVAPEEHDQRAIWLIPAPSPRASDVLGLLLLAGRSAPQLEPTRGLMPAYRALALGFADWFQRRGRDELVRGAHLTERDLDLLRHESMGHGSKRIGAALNTEPKTIDCRFHRLNVRLGVANRREAVRLCQRYGLL
jgi:DNA-binding CsgD family transcriptional regulator